MRLTERMQEAALRAIASPRRRAILRLVWDGERSSGDIAEHFDVSWPAISQNLKVLEEAGLVTRSRDAQRRPVHLEAEVLDLMTRWIEHYRQRAEERYSRLDAVLAGLDRPDTTAAATPEEGTAS
jgi:DNA-binding transcriptional ArsR family regulator